MTYLLAFISLIFCFVNFSDEIGEFLKSDNDEKSLGSDYNAFQRKLIYQLLEQKYRETISASTQSSNNQKVAHVDFS